MDQTGGGDLSPLRAYLGVLRRRRIYVALALVLTPAAAVGLTMTQPKRYEAAAKVLLTTQDLGAALAGGTSVQSYQDPNRVAQTQLEIARVPQLARRVIRHAGLHAVTAEQFLRQSHVATEPTADVLDFHVRAATRSHAETLATTYATEFTHYRRELQAAAYGRAERDLSRRLSQLRASHQRSSQLYESLLEKREQVRTLATLGVQDAVLLRVADQANQVQPRPLRNGLLGVLLGGLLGLLAAGVGEALDTRTRSSDQISNVLDAPLLGRVPEPQHRRRREGWIAMIEDPHGMEAEAFRVVRANVDFMLRQPHRRTIMVTSALGVEGKTTTLANLSVALAIAGRRVIAVDFDLRRPSLYSLFGLENSPGVGEVAAGSATLAEALVPAKLRFDYYESDRQGRQGRLDILPAGLSVRNPGEIVGQAAVRHLLAELRERADLVLVDTPPLLQVADAATLMESVDGVVVVVRSNTSTREDLVELRRVLARAPADTLGFVLTGSLVGEALGYGSYPRRIAGVS